MDRVLREVGNETEETYDEINISPFTRHLTGSVYHTSSVLYDPLCILTARNTWQYYAALPKHVLNFNAASLPSTVRKLIQPRYWMSVYTGLYNWNGKLHSQSYLHSPVRLHWVQSHKFILFHCIISFCCRHCPSTFLPSPPSVRADAFPHVPATFASLLWSTQLSSSSREVMVGDFQVPVFLPPCDLF